MRRERRRPRLESRPAHHPPTFHRTAIQARSFLPVSHILQGLIHDAAKANGMAHFDTFHHCLPAMSQLSNITTSRRDMIGFNTPPPPIGFETFCSPLLWGWSCLSACLTHPTVLSPRHPILLKPPRTRLEPGSCIIEEYLPKKI